MISMLGADDRPAAPFHLDRIYTLHTPRASNLIPNLSAQPERPSHFPPPVLNQKLLLTTQARLVSPIKSSSVLAQPQKTLWHRSNNL
jgi:hypothetical protein